MKIIIKNMVCDRCILVIENILNELNIVSFTVHMGEVDFTGNHLNINQIEKFRSKIEPLGFEIINDKKSKLIEGIKKHIILLVQQQNMLEKVKLSDYLVNHLYRDYTHMSNLFSTVEGVTIEQYFIGQKIEKTKELLVYDELTLSEISYKLGYSSVAHLSAQFKKITGMTPSKFKKLRDNNKRQPIDKV